MNNNNSIKTTSKIKYNGFERRVSPFFNSLPHDVPVDWLIPFLMVFEDLQYLQYIINNKSFPNIRKWVLNIYALFNPDITNNVFYDLFNIFLGLALFYLFFILCFYIQSNGRKSLSKKHLYIYNSFYHIIFRYSLSIVFSFFTNVIYVCKHSYFLEGIHECSSQKNDILVFLTYGNIFAIIFYNYMYNNFFFNTNCLSESKLFGSIHRANNNKLMFTKFYLAMYNNVFPNFFRANSINFEKMQSIFILINMVIFLYFAYSQLKTQPYYSSTVNNYRFAVYSSIAIFSLYSLLTCLININKTKFIADTSFIIFAIIFVISYKYNEYYYKKSLKRIFKKFNEKKMVSDLRKSTSVDELRYGPTKLQKKDVYKSIERITNEVFIKKEIKVFNSFYECEFSCRFLRNNRNLEAFTLMRKIFDEGMLQFKHEADVYIMAWYYIHSMKIFYRDNNLLQDYNAELFNCNNILYNAMDLKLDARKKYLINRAECYNEIEKRENSMNINTADVEASIRLEELKTKVAVSHIQCLQEIKELFKKLRSSTNTKDISTYNSNITKICKLRDSTYSQYNRIIRQYPDSKDVIKLYVLFLIDVMNKDELAYKYANGNPYQCEKTPSNEKMSSENNIKYKKSLSSSNSLGSMSHSEDFSASGMGRELRKKINSKNLMIKKFITPIKNLKNRMTFLTFLFIIIFCIQAIITIMVFNTVKIKGDLHAQTVNIPASMKTIQFRIRQLSYNLILNDYRNYGKNIGTLRGALFYLIDTNMNNVSTYMDIPIDNPLITSVGKYSFDSYETLTLADSYKYFISNTLYCVNRDMLTPNETVYDIIYEPHFKYFIANSKSNFDHVFNQCKEILSNHILDLLTNLEYIVFCLEVVLVIITLAIAYITFVPLNKSVSKIVFSSFKTFKYFSKENFEQVITDYEEKIETLCQSFDLDKENYETNIKSKLMNGNSNNNLKLILSLFAILIYIIIAMLPVINTVTDSHDVLSILSKSSDRYSILMSIQHFTYEVINQDRSIFLEDEPNRILNDLVNKIETIQDELKSGSYGGPTFNKYPFVDDVIKENGCHRLALAHSGTTCDDVIYDSSYGFSEDVGTLPLDELIRTYLFYVKNFINDVDDGKYISLPFSSKENIRIIFDQIWNDNFFKFQESIIDNIVGDIQYLNYKFTDYLFQIMESNSQSETTLIIFGIAIFLIFDLFVFNKIYNEKIREMDSLVSFVFLVPQSIVNKNEKFKRFIETTQTED